MSDSGQDRAGLVELQGRAMSLLLRLQSLREEVESLTEQRSHALRRYGKARRLCNRLLGQASGIQARAGNLGMQIYAQKSRLVALQRQVEALEFFGGNVDGIKADLREAAEILERWGSAPDAAGQTADDDESKGKATKGDIV